MSFSPSPSSTSCKLPAGDQDLILLGSDDDDGEEEEEVRLDQAQVLKVQTPIKIAVNGTVAPDKEQKLASMLPKALMEAAKRAVEAHKNNKKMEGSKPKVTVEDDDDIQVEYEKVTRVRRTTVPIVLDKDLHNEVVSAIMASGGAKQIGSNVINAKFGNNATLSVSIVSNGGSSGGGDDDSTRKRKLQNGTASNTAVNGREPANGASPSSSRQMTKLKAVNGSKTQGFQTEVAGLVKKEEEGEAASHDEHTSVTYEKPENKNGVNGASTSTSSPSWSKTNKAKPSNSQQQRNGGSSSAFEAFIQQQQSVKTSSGQERKRFQSQFTDFIQQQAKNVDGGDESSDPEIPDLKPEGLVRKRRRTCREGDDDPPLPALTPSVKKQVGRRTKPKAERVRAGNLEEQKRFMRELDVNVVGGTAFVPIGIFRQMFTDFEVDLNEVMRCDGAWAHLRFSGWAVSEISLALASEILRKRGGPPEVVSEGFLQLARRHPAPLIEDCDHEDGKKTKEAATTWEPSLRAPKISRDVVKSRGMLTPLFRTARKPVRASPRLQAQTREQRLNSERSQSPPRAASPALPQTTAMEKKGINLPKGWVIQVLQPPPMSKYKYVSPDGKTFRSLEKAMAYGKTAPNNSSTETAIARNKKKGAVVADKRSNAGKFVCNKDQLWGCGEEEEVGKGMTLHEIAERKRAACRKFASNADSTKFRGLADDSGRVRKRRRKKKVLVRGPGKPTMPGSLSLSGLKVKAGGCDGWFAKKICLVKALSEPLKKVHGGEEERAKKRRSASGGPRRRSDRVKVTFSGGNEEMLDLDEWSVATALKEADGEDGQKQEDLVETAAEVALRIQETSHGKASQAWEWRRKSFSPVALVGRFVSRAGGKEEIIVRGKEGVVSRERSGEGVIAAYEVMSEFGPGKLSELFLD